jgi:hypothetical protein
MAGVPKKIARTRQAYHDGSVLSNPPLRRSLADGAPPQVAWTMTASCASLRGIVLDPWLSLVALAVGLAAAGPLGPSRDPGPSPLCPRDMRLVEGLHSEESAGLCTDVRSDKPRCWRYHEGLTVLEGQARAVRVCMDQFEAPNKRGHDPYVLYSYKDAKRWCEKRGKRMCHEREWELACEGPDHLPWAYGWAVNVNLCNSHKQWIPVQFSLFGKDRELAEKESARLWQGEPSGRFPGCVSPFGVYDMMGNVEEWVSAREERRFPGALMGGFWSKPWTGCRGTNDAHEPDFAFYETGFRCCKDPSPSAPAASAAPAGAAAPPP